MRFRTALMAAMLCAASAALAQSPAPAAGTASTPAAAARPAPTQAGTQARTEGPSAAPEKVDPAKDAAIRHLLEITDESKLGEKMGNFIEGRVREGISRMLTPDRLPKFMETFTQKFNASAPPNSVTDAQVLIYAKHFSMEDVQSLIQFYETPAGQRVVKAMPQVSRETETASRDIDQKAALDVLREMSVEYTELKQILPPENAAAPGTAPSPATAPAPAPAPTPSAAPAPKPAPPQ